MPDRNFKKIYTKTGDDGTTGLFGGTRVSKNSLRIESYGTVDELNSLLGVARTHFVDDLLDGHLAGLQNELFIAGADLATPLSGSKVSITRINAQHIGDLERSIDSFDGILPPLAYFILPGGHPAAAQLHFARTVCRRAERLCVSLASEEQINGMIIPYLNRLSDLLFVLARYANHASCTPEIQWNET